MGPLLIVAIAPTNNLPVRISLANGSISKHKMKVTADLLEPTEFHMARQIDRTKPSRFIPKMSRAVNRRGQEQRKESKHFMGRNRLDVATIVGGILPFVHNEAVHDSQLLVEISRPEMIQ